MARNNKFANKSKKLISKCETSIIAREARFVGDLNLHCKLHIDGEFLGNITSSSAIVVAKTGLFEGEILDAYKVIVTGTLKGKVTTQELEILKGGKFIGEMKTSNLTIEPGAIFEGVVAQNKNNEQTKDNNK